MSEHDNHGNGNGAPDEMLGAGPLVERLIIEYNRATDAMQIGGKTMSDESAAAMLRRALFLYEMKLRATVAAGLAQAAREQAEAAELAHRVRRGIPV